jgi:hypothetical protein
VGQVDAEHERERHRGVVGRVKGVVERPVHLLRARGAEPVDLLEVLPPLRLQQRPQPLAGGEQFVVLRQALRLLSHLVFTPLGHRARGFGV